MCQIIFLNLNLYVLPIKNKQLHFLVPKIQCFFIKHNYGENLKKKT